MAPISHSARDCNRRFEAGKGARGLHSLGDVDAWGLCPHGRIAAAAPRTANLIHIYFEQRGVLQSQNELKDHMKAKTLDYLQLLQTHSGYLIRLKTELYWYDGRGYDGSPGRICLLLAAVDARYYLEAASAASKYATWCTGAARNNVVLLLVDGSPHWVLLAEVDMELLQT